MQEATKFRYHPDPVRTGSAAPTDAPCDVCGQPAVLRYVGPIFGRQVDVLCLRCIADGRAARELALPDGEPAQFTDAAGAPHVVPSSALEEVSQRTPGFVGWQQEHWLYHCSDAAAYLGRVGWDEVKDWPDVLTSLRGELIDLGVPVTQTEERIRWLSRDGDLTAYLFECLHCGTRLAYSDAS